MSLPEPQDLSGGQLEQDISLTGGQLAEEVELAPGVLAEDPVSEFTDTDLVLYYSLSKL